MKDQHSYLNELQNKELICPETLIFLQSSKKAKKVDKKGKQKIEYSVPKLRTNFPNIDHIAFIQNAFGVSVLQLMQISDVKLQALKNMATAFFNQASLLRLSTDKALELSQWIGALRRDGLISKNERNDLVENVGSAEMLFRRDDKKQLLALLKYGFAMKDFIRLTQDPKKLIETFEHLIQCFLKETKIPEKFHSDRRDNEVATPFEKLIKLGISRSVLASLAIKKPHLLTLIEDQIEACEHFNELFFLQFFPQRIITYIFEIASEDHIPLKSFLTFLNDNPYVDPETIKTIMDAYTSDSHLSALISMENLNADIKHAAISTYITLMALGIPTADIEIEKIKEFFGLKTSGVTKTGSGQPIEEIQDATELKTSYFSESNNDQHAEHLEIICANLKRLLEDKWLDLESLIKTMHTLPEGLHFRLSDVENTIHMLSLGVSWDALCQSKVSPSPTIPEDVPSYFDTEDGRSLFKKLLEIGCTDAEIKQSIHGISHDAFLHKLLLKKHHSFVILQIRAGMGLADVWRLPINHRFSFLEFIETTYRLSDARITFALKKAGAFSYGYHQKLLDMRLANFSRNSRPQKFFSLLKHSTSPDFLAQITAFIKEKELDPLFCFETWIHMVTEYRYSGSTSLNVYIQSAKNLKSAMSVFAKFTPYFYEPFMEFLSVIGTKAREFPQLLSFGITFTHLEKLAKRLHKDLPEMLESIEGAILHFVSSGYSFKSLLECAKKSAAAAYQALFYYGYPQHMRDSFDSKSTGTNNKKLRRSKELTPLQLCYKNSLGWLKHLASSNPDPSIKASLSSSQLEAISVALNIGVQYLKDKFKITAQAMPQEEFKDLMKRIIEESKKSPIKLTPRNISPSFLKQRLPAGITNDVTSFLSAKDLLIAYRVKREPMPQKPHPSSDHAMAPATGGASK